MKLKSIGMVSLLALTLGVAHDAYAQVREAPQAPAAAGGGGRGGGGRGGGGPQAALGTPVLGLTLAPAKDGAKLKVTSTAFKEGGKLPDLYSQNDKGISPPLTWSKGPAGTQSYVLLAEDAGGNRVDPTFHWVAFDIPATMTGLPQAVPTDAKLPNGALQGLNARQAAGFMGPKPPMGVSHPYHFEVFAVDMKLGLDPAKADRKAVVAAMTGHVLASGEILVNYMTPQPAFNPRDLTGVWMQQGGMQIAGLVGGGGFAKAMDWTPEYAKILKEHQDDIAAGRPFRHDEGTCLPRGLVGMMTSGVYPLEIFQTGDSEIALNKETPGSLYRIHLNQQHRPADEQFPHFFGDNIGHWEGDILMVDTISLGLEDTLDAQTPNSPDIHVTQKIHRITYDTIENTLTLEDPKAWTKPVTVTVQYKRHDAFLKNAWQIDEAECDNERNGVDANGNPYVKGVATK